MRFIVTFPVGGPLADKYSTIYAVDEMAVRLALIGVYGRTGWAGIYEKSGTSAAMVAGHHLTEVEFGAKRETARDYAS